MNIIYILITIFCCLAFTLVSTLISRIKEKHLSFFALGIPLIFIIISRFLIPRLISTDITNCAKFNCISTPNPTIIFITQICTAFIISYSANLFLTKKKFKLIPTYIISTILTAILINPVYDTIIRTYIIK